MLSLRPALSAMIPAILLVVALLLSSCSEPAAAPPEDVPAAADAEMRDEAAKALVQEAIELYRQEGPEIAFADMNAPDTLFRRGSLYIFANDADDVIVVHAGDPELVGQNADDVMDADGLPVGPIIREAASEEGGWAEYRFEDYETGEVQPKRSWVRLEDGYVFGAGVYETDE